MAKSPAPAAADARPLWEQNGMTEAEWNALSPNARAWRSEHPRSGPDVHHHGGASDKASASVGGAAAHDAANAQQIEARRADAQGAQVVLTGDAKDAARGAPHGTIEGNTAARDAAIADGHVLPETSPTAIAETLSASVGASLVNDPSAAAEVADANRRELGERAKAAAEAANKADPLAAGGKR